MKKIKIKDFEKSYMSDDIDNMPYVLYIKLLQEIEEYFERSLTNKEKMLIKKREKLLSHSSNHTYRLLFSENKIKLYMDVLKIEGKTFKRMPINMINTYFSMLFNRMSKL